MKTILDKISENYQRLTPSQSKVAQFIFNNINEAFLLNSFQIAKITGVSESTVTRFVSNLGFSGFPQFKREMAQQILEGFSTTTRLAESAENLEDTGSVFSRILKGDIENIRSLTTKISEEVFEGAVNTLCAARSIYILGLRSSYALAFYLAFALRFFLDLVVLIKPGIGDVPEQVLGATEHDALVVISFKRFTRDSFNIAERIKRKKTRVVAITNSELSPMARLADVTLVASTQIPTYIESYTAPMSLINALITAIALRKKDKAMSALEKLEVTLEEFETYIS
jgi:DNA-binding MurR/RpiR family transcriptional regulator